ncbi:MAG TPA: hypothetical protein VHX38_01990 [Pseudonocardiaceae bacterium]|jgi:hypothetical protein|nr:hypothetical protein [Pseudonocardiaceae bacterium]
MSEITIPDEAGRAIAEAIPLARIAAAVKADYHASVLEDDNVSGLIMEAVRVAAPLIVAADRLRLADSLRALDNRLADLGIHLPQDVEEIIGDLERTAGQLRAEPTS